MNAPLTYEFDAGIATIKMDDGKANVMNSRMLQALNTALDRAQADQAIVVLTGRTGMFSGGFDLAVFKGDPQEQYQMLEAGARLTERLLSFAHPVVAVCTGHAIAMGAFLLLCADVRIGLDRETTIQVNELQIGLTLPRFAVEVCRQRLAPAHLNIATLSAQPYSPHKAVLAGFLDEVVPAASLASALHSNTTRLQKLHAPSFTATKLRLRGAVLTALHEAINEDMVDWTARIRNTASKSA
ncbi:crotonase/enoyl-CoA hydratase family protein [Rhodoferax sp. UBA5149]|uniref:crotonase/enoyl-CoA hydratase family protein n=1 Tax=Rhodoferax sp. UBA5149 TaxID=1947379 RepID=UPI0025D2270D|nr:crotonase/enoyl-CoA hydratase family protein [Rhodoferax sp. UBA5149]